MIYLRKFKNSHAVYYLLARFSVAVDRANGFLRQHRCPEKLKHLLHNRPIRQSTHPKFQHSRHSTEIMFTVQIDKSSVETIFSKTKEVFFNISNTRSVLCHSLSI